MSTGINSEEEDNMLLKRLLSKGQAGFLSAVVDESMGCGGSASNDSSGKMNSSGNNKENPQRSDSISSLSSIMGKSAKDDIILRALLNTSDLEPQVLQLESVFELNRQNSSAGSKPSVGSQVVMSASRLMEAIEKKCGTTNTTTTTSSRRGSNTKGTSKKTGLASAAALAANVVAATIGVSSTSPPIGGRKSSSRKLSTNSNSGMIEMKQEATTAQFMLDTSMSSPSNPNGGIDFEPMLNINEARLRLNSSTSSTTTKSKTSLSLSISLYFTFSVHGMFLFNPVLL